MYSQLEQQGGDIGLLGLFSLVVPAKSLVRKGQAGSEPIFYQIRGN